MTKATAMAVILNYPGRGRCFFPQVSLYPLFSLFLGKVCSRAEKTNVNFCKKIGLEANLFYTSLEAFASKEGKGINKASIQTAIAINC